MNFIFRLLALIIFFSILLITPLCMQLWVNYYGKQKIYATEDRYISIEAGSNTCKIIQELKKNSIIDSFTKFKIYVYWHRADKQLKAGDYFFSANTTNDQLIDKLITNKQVVYKIRIEEGKTIKEALDALSNHAKLKNCTNFSDFTANTIIKPEGFKGGNNSIEGLLFPDTYEFVCGTSVETILRIANKKLMTVLAEEWSCRDKNLPYKTPYEALIIASLIEKESAIEAEKPKIAGIFSRRLKKKMRLQADPSVIYGLEDSFNGKLTKKMLSIKTNYNTYIIFGLPPTPIALVSRSSIYAALHPDTSNALYFVAKGNGEHHFSDTLEQHNQAIKQYLHSVY